MPEKTRIDYRPSVWVFLLPFAVFLACASCVLLARLPGWLTLLFLSAFFVPAAAGLKQQGPVGQVLLQGDQWQLCFNGSQAFQPACLQQVVFVSRWLLVVDVLVEGRARAQRLYFAADNTEPDAFRHLSRHVHRRRYTSPPG